MLLSIHSILLTTAILAGQLIKLPIAVNSGSTLLDLVVGGLCLFGIWKSKFQLNKPPIYILTGFGFVVITFISLLLTPLNLSNPERLISFLYILRLGIYLLLGWLIYQGSIPLKPKIPQVLLESGIGLAILGLLQLIFLPNLGFLISQGWDPHFFRTASTFLDPNFLGAYLVLTLLVILKIKNDKIFFVITYLALLTTFSRGAYLAFLVSFGIFSIVKKSFRLGVITILLFTGLMLGFFTYEHLVATPRGVDRTKSAEFRLDSWQQGLHMFEKHPVLGVGFNAYRFALKEYNLADEQFIGSHGATSNDSSLLFVAATTGSLGLLSYLFWLGTCCWYGWKKNPVLLAGLLGLIAQSFFANTLFYPTNLLWIILLAVVKYQDVDG